VSDVLERDLFYGFDQDFALIHWVATAHFNVRAFPDADAARNKTSAHPLPKTLRENHRDEEQFICREASTSLRA
jgi:hypothetical protein